MRLFCLALLAASTAACRCTEQAVQVYPEIRASTLVIDFGDVAIGSGVWRTLELTNDGKARLTVTELVTVEPFSVRPVVLDPLATSASASLRVGFAPVKGGATTGELIINSDAANTPGLKVRLTGTGVACASSCDAPPMGRCANAETFAGFKSPGRCVNGQCEYEEVQTPCSGGCVNEVCTPDPCSAVVCGASPLCRGPGQCVDGACRFELALDAGCDDGDTCTSADRCNALATCSGTPVTCDSPPAPICAAGGLRRTFAAPGTCGASSGCSYPFTDAACPALANASVGCDAGRCDFSCATSFTRCGSGCCSPQGRLALGLQFSCAIAQNGELRCWGANDKGQLGNGTFSPSGPLGPVRLDAGVTSVSAGQRHACAVTAQGAVACWGAGELGQLGRGSSDGGSQSPAEVTGLSTDQVRVTCGTFFACALSSNGTPRCWGHDSAGQLGDGASGLSQISLTPQPMQGLDAGAVSVSAGDNSTFVQLSTGEVWGCGINARGELGVGATSAPVTTPTKVPLLGNTMRGVSTHSDSAHGCALLPDGGVLCWGYNSTGQIGDATRTNQPGPVPVLGLAGPVREISVAARHTCAILGSGALQCWGANDYGQLGDGTKTPDRLTPVLVPLDAGVVSVNGSWSHTCALLVDGSVWCWGSNFSGETNPNSVGIEQLAPNRIPGF